MENEIKSLTFKEMCFRKGQEVCDLDLAFREKIRELIVKDSQNPVVHPTKEEHISVNKLYQKECANGNATACYESAVSFRYGMSDGAKDKAKALDSFKKACDMGYEYGCRDFKVLSSEK